MSVIGTASFPIVGNDCGGGGVALLYGSRAKPEYDLLIADVLLFSLLSTGTVLGTDDGRSGGGGGGDDFDFFLGCTSGGGGGGGKDRFYTGT